jgi:O-antigen ligase
MKTTLGIYLVTSALFLWLLISYKSKVICIKKSEVYWPVFGFILWNFISLFWVEDGYLATVMLVQFTAFSLVFLLTINIFDDYKKIETLIKFVVVSLTLVSIIGLLQYYFFNIDFIKNLFTQIVTPSSTFGNKNMASHFVVMALPLSLILIFTSKSNRQVVLYSITTIIGAWFLIYIVARQAYIATIVELFVLSLFFILDKWKNKDKALLATMAIKKNKSIAFFSILIFLVFAANFTNQGFSVESNAHSKIAKIQSISVDEHNPRIPAWRNTFEMIKEHPVIGVGVGQWQAKYPLYYDRVMKDIIFNEGTRLKRLHNDYLEIFANVGVVGYVFLLWLSWLMIRKIWSILTNHKSEYRFYVLGLTLGIIGFLTVAAFSFPIRMFYPAFLLFVFIGVIASINSTVVTLKFDKGRYLFLAIAVGVFSVFVTWKSLGWIFAKHFNTTAVQLLLHNESKLSVKYGLIALSLNPKSSYYFYTTARALHDAGEVDSSILYYKKAINISPFHTFALLDMANAYKDIKDFFMEKKILDFILRFDPKNVLASARLVINLTNSQALQDASIVYKNMKSNFEYFKDRGSFGPYHHELAKTARLVRDYKYIEYVYKDLVKRFPIAENFTKLAATQFYFLNDRRRGIQNYKKALELNPEVQDSEEIKDLIVKYESNNK